MVIVSEHATVKNITAMLMKAGESGGVVNELLTLTHAFDCYRKVFAYDIEADNSNGSLAIAGVIERHNTTTTLVTTCTITTEGKTIIIVSKHCHSVYLILAGRDSQLPVILAVSVLLLILLTIPLISLTVLLIRWRRMKTRYTMV